MIRFNLFARTALTLGTVAALAGAVPASAQSNDGLDRRVSIENRSGQNILFVRGSPVTDQSFGDDRIPDRVVGNGQRTTVDFSNGTSACRYDLRVTLSDGSNVDRMNVNVCQVSRWTINRRTNTIR